MDRSEIQKYITELELGVEEHYRGDCPVCGGSNTFSVTRDGGECAWNCYKASCNVKGRMGALMSASEIEQLLGAELSPRIPTFEIPSTWTSYENPKTIAYLKRVNALDAVRDKRAYVRYDPQQDRHVFISWLDGHPVGAYGRGVKPKWLIYTKRVKVPYVVPRRGTYLTHEPGEFGVLVEDCASACAVSQYMDGIALLGTNLISEYIPFLTSYKEIVIALDKDASDKAIEMHRLLSFYVHTKVILLQKDLKECNNIREQLQ